MKKSSRQEPAKPRKADARILRTQQRLGRALIALIQEKPVEQVTVQEVLDRAQVGRSTFYVHFRDKDDLFLSQMERGLEMWSTALIGRKEGSRRVAPVAEMFGHIGEQKKLYRALVDSGRIASFFELAQEYFARGIQQRLKELGRGRDLDARELSARSHALAASMLSLLKWWLDRGTKEPPQQMDELFHEIVWKGMH